MLSGNRSGISANVAVVDFLNIEGPGPLPETDIIDSGIWKLETKLRKNATLRNVYYKRMLDYIQRGQMEFIDTGKEQEGTFYWPHHAVSKGKTEIHKMADLFRRILT
jgi:hypothetical protein